MSNNNTNASAKPSRYLKYAFGEIILVVIGILIALQISNWNENRKQNIYEVKMLDEIKTALKNDKVHMESMSQRLNEPIEAANMFIDMIYNKQSYNDTLYKYLAMLRTGMVYQYNPGPYQAIKYSGLDKISNDSLRNNLIRFYDFEFPRHKELTTWSDRNYDKNLEKLDTFYSGEPYIFITEEGEKKIYRDVPKDLLSNPDFLLFLRSIKLSTERVKYRFENFLDDIQAVIDQIEDIKND